MMRPWIAVVLGACAVWAACQLLIFHSRLPPSAKVALTLAGSAVYLGVLLVGNRRASAAISREEARRLQKQSLGEG